MSLNRKATGPKFGVSLGRELMYVSVLAYRSCQEQGGCLQLVPGPSFSCAIATWLPLSCLPVPLQRPSGAMWDSYNSHRSKSCLKALPPWSGSWGGLHLGIWFNPKKEKRLEEHALSPLGQRWPHVPQCCCVGQALLALWGQPNPRAKCLTACTRNKTPRCCAKRLPATVLPHTDP